MVTVPHFRRVFFAVGVLLIWISLPSVDSPKQVDSHAGPMAPVMTHRIGMDTPQVVIDSRVGPYEVSPTVRPTVFGPGFQPPDRLNATPHNSSAIEIWFRWLFPWSGSDLTDSEQLNRR